MKNFNFILVIIAIAAIGCSNKDDMRLSQIIDNATETLKPLNKQAALAYWNGTTTGQSQFFEEYSRLSLEISKFYSNKDIFEELKEIKERNRVSDPTLKRELEILYNNFLSNQTDSSLLEKIINKTSELEQKYASYRAIVEGKEVSDNRIVSILSESINNKLLEEAWSAHKEIGPIVAEDIVELVKLRNKVANSLGFDNFHTMTLSLSDQDPNTISDLFDQLDSLTKDSFNNLKAEMDALFSKKYGVEIGNLMPWHYQCRFFQESPQLYPVDLDSYYRGKNLEELTATFFNSIGLDIDQMLKNSDLYEKPGKNQHAYCIDIDTEGDVRVLANISDNEQWMGTMLHEFGHAVYSFGHSYPENPYFLRNAAHPFTTEAVAMIFGRLSRNPEWMRQMLNLSDDEINKISEDCHKSLRLQQLVFSRWSQVMYRFEKEMYANPDQDLNTLWWCLVEKYQGLKKPKGRDKPDWATKVHIALYPCYYHNYQLGELLASQMHYYILENLYESKHISNQSYIGNKEIGKWMTDKIFVPGMRYNWNQMIQNATGEKLTPKYYAKQFVQ